MITATPHCRRSFDNVDSERSPRGKDRDGPAFVACRRGRRPSCPRPSAAATPDRQATVIALGAGTSHTPMLCMTPSSWARWGARDEAKTDLVDGAGRPVTYAALVERAPATLAAEQAEEVFATKLARTGAALDALAARINAEGLDALIVVG